MNVFDRKTFVWGTGKKAGRLKEDLRRFQPYAYVDNNPATWGHTFEGKPVMQPDVLKDETDICVLVAIKDTEEVRSQIERDYPQHSKSVIDADIAVGQVKMMARYRNEDGQEYAEIMQYLENHFLGVFNYGFAEDYHAKDYEAVFDDGCAMYYVEHNGKKLYFSKNYDTEEKALDYYTSLLIEQDRRSPHRYLKDGFEMPEDAVIIDAGAAEGMFTLDVVDGIKEAYLIEPDRRWIEALKYTFKPYRDKIHIINKSLSNYEDEETTTIDALLSAGNLDFIKMDIEGEEYYALMGAENVLKRSSKMKCVVCTYHQEFAYEVINRFFAERSYLTQPSHGYMWFPDRTASARAYDLRRGVLYAEKPQLAGARRDYQYAIFGAGKYGRRALAEYGRENIVCFIDNNPKIQNTYIDGVLVTGLSEFLEWRSDEKVILAVLNSSEIEAQLEDLGFQGYFKYHPSIPQFTSYWSPNVIIQDFYGHNKQAKNEQEWNERQKRQAECVQAESAQFVRDWMLHPVLFRHIEIETYNRCNGTCSFCPVSVKNETRPEAKMQEEVFRKIIDELSSLHYSGRISLFSNNEPFLDDRILEFHRYAREKLPDARFHLFTNGTKLNLELFQEVIGYLDELIIDNYNASLELIPNNAVIYDYCKEHRELMSKVSILVRKPDEILTSRGGNAPNRENMASYGDVTCILPFRQMIIRPDGKVSLCCNDALGENTLGDVSVQPLWDVWFGEGFGEVRRNLQNGRGSWEHCRFCDTFIMD